MPECPSCREELGTAVDLHPLVIGHQAEFGLWGWFCIRCSAAYQEDGEEGVGIQVSDGRKRQRASR